MSMSPPSEDPPPGAGSSSSCISHHALTRGEYSFEIHIQMVIDDSFGNFVFSARVVKVTRERNGRLQAVRHAFKPHRASSQHAALLQALAEIDVWLASAPLDRERR